MTKRHCSRDQYKEVISKNHIISQSTVNQMYARYAKCLVPIFGKKLDKTFFIQNLRDTINKKNKDKKPN